MMVMGRTYIDPDFVEEIISASMEANDFVVFLSECEGSARFNAKLIRCSVLISREFKHNYHRGLATKDLLVGACHFSDVFTWIVHHKLRLKETEKKKK